MFYCDQDIQEWQYVVVLFYLLGQFYVGAYIVHILMEIFLFFIAVWPDDEDIACLADPTGWFQLRTLYGLLLKSVFGDIRMVSKRMRLDEICSD